MMGGRVVYARPRGIVIAGHVFSTIFFFFTPLKHAFLLYFTSAFRCMGCVACVLAATRDLPFPRHAACSFFSRARFKSPHQACTGCGYLHVTGTLCNWKASAACLRWQERCYRRAQQPLEAGSCNLHLATFMCTDNYITLQRSHFWGQRDALNHRSTNTPALKWVVVCIWTDLFIQINPGFIFTDNLSFVWLLLLTLNNPAGFGFLFNLMAFDESYAYWQRGAIFFFFSA